MFHRQDVRFIRSEKRAVQMQSDPRHVGFKICDENLVVQILAKKHLELRRSWSVGFSILEISKFIMMSIFYKVIQPAFGNLSLVFTDTDSFAIIVPVESAYKATEMLSCVMDFSNLPEDDPMYSRDRKNVCGFMKNEVSDDEIRKIVALKSKTYAFVTKKQKMESKCKGVKKSARKNQLKFQNFVDCIQSKTAYEVTQHTLNSKDHVNRLMLTKKRGLSSMDDKRYLICERHSVPYGSVLIKQFLETGICFFCDNPTKLY